MFKKFYRWVTFNGPSATTLSGWNAHHKAYKTHAPIRYFFFRGIPRAYRKNIVARYTRITFWLKYRLHPRYRFHVIKTQLPYGYYEADDRMIYAAFALICDYVEIELSALVGSKKYRDKKVGIERLEYMVNYNSNLPPNTPTYEKLSAAESKFYRELQILYTWWYEDFLTFDEKLKGIAHRYPITHPEGERFSDRSPRTVLSEVVLRSWAENRDKITQAHAADADEMLLRACKIRHHLWS